MTHELLADDGWAETIELLGGEDLLTRSARETKAFLRPRGVQSAPDLLRLARSGFSTKIHLKTPNAFIWTATHTWPAGSCWRAFLRQSGTSSL
ncbi:hypothetical protein [Mesorhizobium sp. M0037]|uniref:hypothetical protein n=1 Tax=unclassified Mesorhizobium TaxID=325217 RepID=UPI003337279F